MFRHPQATPSRGGMTMNQTVDVNIKPPKPPERPLVPYMRFSRKMWSIVKAELPEGHMWEVGKKIGQLWREASFSDKQEFVQEYEREKIEHDKAMKAYHQSSAFQQYLKNRAKAPLEKGGMPIPGNGGRRAEAGGVVIQPVDEDEGIEYSAKRIAAARFERNHRLIAELFSSSVVADSRNVVMQHRMDTLKKQGNSLKLHQEKLEEELVRLEKVFNDKKRQLEKNSEEFAVNLKKVCDDKPQLDADKFNSMVDEWKGKLLDAYKEYQSNQEAIKKKQEAEKQQTPMLYSLVEESTPPPAPAPDAQSSEDATPDASRESTQKAASDEQMEVDGESANEAAEATSDEKASEESNYDSNNGKKAAVEDDPAEASPAEDTKADTTFVETGEKEGEGEEKTEEAAATDA